MCLHLVSHQKIARLFARLCQQVAVLNLQPEERVQLDNFIDYMDKQWINNSFWTTSRWSVFEQILPVRTNNDCKGWHFRVNGQAHVSGMNLYELIDLLHDEALDIPMERERVAQHMSSRRERDEYV